MKKLIVCITLFLALLARSTGHCEDAAIDNVVVEKGASLKVSFAVKNAFTREIEEAIKSGVPTSFTFIVELNRVKSLWFNENIGRWEFRHTVKYDTLKEEYEITLDEAGQNTLRTKDYNEMKKSMSAADPVTLMPSRAFVRGAEYEMKVMAELKTVRLPFLLNYMLFFVRLWDVETGWFTYSFTP